MVRHAQIQYGTVLLTRAKKGRWSVGIGHGTVHRYGGPHRSYLRDRGRCSEADHDGLRSNSS